MSSTRVKTNKPPAYTEEAGIECSPGSCARACGACLALLLSLVAIAALGVIAGGTFWTAQSMYRVTDNHHTMKVKFCSSCGNSCTYNQAPLLQQILDELPGCPH